MFSVNDWKESRVIEKADAALTCGNLKKLAALSEGMVLSAHRHPYHIYFGRPLLSVGEVLIDTKEYRLQGLKALHEAAGVANYMRKRDQDEIKCQVVKDIDKNLDKFSPLEQLRQINFILLEVKRLESNSASVYRETELRDPATMRARALNRVRSVGEGPLWGSIGCADDMSAAFNTFSVMFDRLSEDMRNIAFKTPQVAAVVDIVINGAERVARDAKYSSSQDVVPSISACLGAARMYALEEQWLRLDLVAYMFRAPMRTFARNLECADLCLRVFPKLSDREKVDAFKDIIAPRFPSFGPDSPRADFIKKIAKGNFLDGMVKDPKAKDEIEALARQKLADELKVWEKEHGMDKVRRKKLSKLPSLPMPKEPQKAKRAAEEFIKRHRPER